MCWRHRVSESNTGHDLGRFFIFSVFHTTNIHTETNTHTQTNGPTGTYRTYRPNWIHWPYRHTGINGSQRTHRSTRVSLNGTIFEYALLLIIAIKVFHNLNIVFSFTPSNTIDLALTKKPVKTHACQRIMSSSTSAWRSSNCTRQIALRLLSKHKTLVLQLVFPHGGGSWKTLKETSRRHSQVSLRTQWRWEFSPGNS